MKFFKNMLMVFLGLTQTMAFAGSADGLYLLVRPTSNAVEYAKYIKEFVVAYHKNNGIYDCNDSALNIEKTYQEGPKNINRTLDLNVISNKKERKALMKILSSYRDATNTSGFDAALIYDVNNSYLNFYGISVNSENETYRSKISLANVSDIKKLGEAICQAVVQLPLKTP